MRKGLLFGALLLGLVGLSGCVVVPSHLGFALIQSDKEPITATEVVPRRMGKACGFNILGIFAAGDISIEKAKRNGGIQRVASVDKEVFSVLGAFSQVCVIVTGE